MTRLVAIDNHIHRNLTVDPAKAQEMGADLHMLPVVTSEYLKLVVQFPILFTKNADTGQFVSVALMGFQPGENLFWQEAKLETLYTPLNISRHPFFVGKDEQSGDNYVMCIDTDSAAVSDTHVEPLFDQQGKASDYLKGAQDTLSQLIAGERDTLAFIQTLNELQLLVPLTLEITFENGESTKVKGMYSVDEDKLGVLSADELKRLRDAGYLSLIYTQIASLGQIYALIDKKNQRNNQTSPWFKAAGE